MRKAKDGPVTSKKPAIKRARKKAALKAAPRRTRTRKVLRITEAAVPKSDETFENSISKAQSDVVAAKFGTEPLQPLPTPRPPLPLSYGESHLLLLVRDPQTLFAAWDMSPATLQSLKVRMGSRAFAVSTLTLRLTRAGGPTSVVHLPKKARSRYLKIDGGPSFMAKIGFTTPTGRFELLARSGPCFVPQGAGGRPEAPLAGRRAVLGYREARNVARQALAAPDVPAAEGAVRPRAASFREGSAVAAAVSSKAVFSPARVLGGASDLYRR